MKVVSQIAPVDMTYSIKVEKLDREAYERVIACLVEIADSKGLDTSRFPKSVPGFRELDL